MIKKALVMLIILFVAGSALSSAFIILKKAVKSDNSNFHLAQVFFYKHPLTNVFSAISKSNNIANDVAGMEANAYEAGKNREHVVSDVLPGDCSEPFQRLVLSYNNSLVNYLHDNGYDFSPEARKKYAEYFGIENYKGTAEENSILLVRILAETNELPSPTSMSCK